MAFFVAIDADIHRQTGTGQGERRHDAERAIQPPRMVLRLDVTAHQQMGTRAAMPSDDVADPVHRRMKADVDHGVHHPAAAFHVLRAEGRAVYAAAIRADGPQRIEIAEEVFGVDRDHVSSFRLKGISRFSTTPIACASDMVLTFVDATASTSSSCLCRSRCALPKRSRLARVSRGGTQSRATGRGRPQQGSAERCRRARSLPRQARPHRTGSPGHAARVRRRPACR